MRALLLTAYDRLEMADLPRPVPGTGEVLVRVAACGICGSDVHGLDGSTGRRVPPLVMGHEAAGTIEEIGPGVTGLAAGTRVTFDSTVYCGACFFCQRGEVNLCDRREVLGVSTGEFRRHGAFAEFVVVPERIVYPIPDALTFERAAMIEPVAVALHAVGLTLVGLNESAVVVGAGMIGLLCVQLLRLAGCGRVIAIDISNAKLDLALNMGATDLINSSQQDAPAVVRALTHGRGADVALEAVGATMPVRTAVDSVRKGGTVTLIGNLASDIHLPLQSIVTRQIRLQGSCASASEYPACIDLLARGLVKVDGMISAIAPLEEGAAWFERLKNREPGLNKVLLKP